MTLPRPPVVSAAAVSLTAPRDIEIWNAVMWAYHTGNITPAQGANAMGIPAGQFQRSYEVWKERVGVLD